MVNQRELTEEGLEKNFATNTLGKIRSDQISFFFFLTKDVNYSKKGSQSCEK